MTPSKTFSFVLAVIASILMSACGGGGSDTPSATSAASSGTGQTCTTDIYGTATCVSTSGTFGGAGGGNYVANTLVADTANTTALHVDAHLVNSWGLVFNPQGFSWIANAGTSTSTLYDGDGVAQSLVVTIPLGNPAGIVFNGTTDFTVTEGALSGAAAFIFSTLEGQISAWAPAVDGTHAFTMVDNSASGAAYTGLAIDTGTGADLLYAADFHNAKVTVFNGNYASATTTGNFSDSTLPAGYAPFGIQQIGDKIYVAYAKQDAAAQRNLAGTGLGLVDVFDTQGNLLSHLIAIGGVLNAPWGIALAPANFGKFSGMLLIGNFGDGKINAFNPTTGALVGAVATNDGQPIVTPGLWSLQFGNGINNQPTNTLFYTAGPASETHGLYGRIDMN